MQALIELIAGFIALLASVALSQFGVDTSHPRAPDREVHRVHDQAQNCPDAPAAMIDVKAPAPRC
ncbi:hypothetical protein BH10PSE1_BH10PSE1_03000 [soil metagenome]